MPTRRYGPNPRWWPEGEQWPPQGGHGSETWSGFGRKMFAGAILFITTIVVMAAVAGAIIATSLAGISSGSRWPIVFGTLFLLLVGIRLIRRIFRRSLRPVRELADTAGRLADGDYAARVDVRSSPSMRAVGSSFNVMAERLETADEQRRQLMSDLGHELRTPLAIIRGEIEAVIDGVRDGGPELMASLLDEVDVMERLIEDLRLLSLSEAGVLPLQTELADLVSLLTEVAASYGATADATGVQIKLEVRDGCPPIQMDSVRIRQAVANLVVNSLRAMPDGGILTLEVSVESDRVVVDVSDTGGGIEAALVPEVFDRFLKAGSSDGSGLGLAIARGLIRAHGGDLEVGQTGADGTTMSMWLPH